VRRRVALPCGYLCGIGGTCEVAEFHPACDGGSIPDSGPDAPTVDDGSADGTDPIVGQPCGPGMYCPCGYVCFENKCAVAEAHPACDGGQGD
jgi:hypothetical protein